MWRSARQLRAGHPGAWTLPIALGGVALVQSAVTVLPLALSGEFAADAVAPFLAGAGLGGLSLAVGLLGRRSGAPGRPPGVSD